MTKLMEIFEKILSQLYSTSKISEHFIFIFNCGGGGFGHPSQIFHTSSTTKIRSYVIIFLIIRGSKPSEMGRGGGLNDFSTRMSP